MLLAQDGHARTNKIGEGIASGFLDGAILSPRYQKPESFEQYVREFMTENTNALVLFDPHFFVGTLGGNKLSQLENYTQYFHKELGRLSFSTKKIQEYVQQVIDYQIDLGVSKIISPSVMVRGFDDQWSQILLSLFIESIDYIKSKEMDISDLILSLPVTEFALKHDEEMSDFLDVLTQLDVGGFYIVVERETENNPQWEDYLALSNYMHFVNTLSNNDFKVYSGYSDLVGLLLVGVGATAISTGWWRSQKQFTVSSYMERSGGRQPRATYTSKALLNSIYVTPELQAVYEAGYISDVVGDNELDRDFRSNPGDQVETWTTHNTNQILQHWAVLHELIRELNEQDNVEARLKWLQEKIELAQAIYTRLRHEQIQFEPMTGPKHLSIWKEAIDRFQRGVFSA